MKSSRGRTRARALILALVLLLSAFVFLGVSTAARIQHHWTAAQAGLAQLEQVLSGSNPGLLAIVQDPAQMDTLQKRVRSLDTELIALEASSRPLLPLCRYLGWLPHVGGDIRAAPHLLALARYTADAGLALTEGLSPLATLADAPNAALASIAPKLLAGLTAARPQLLAARWALAQASDARTFIDARDLRPSTRAMLHWFDRYQPLLDSGTAALELMPELLGADGPRTYLVLAQNSHELRATGGFISGVGRVRFENGQVTDVHFQDSYTIDNLSKPHALPPEPLRRYMKAGMLVLRDANWWPDFPTSAQAVAGIYRQDQGEQVDGVIAVDQTTLQLLVQALGPIQVPGYDQPVNAGNLQSELMSFWQAPRLTAPGKETADWWAHRKDFAADLMSALLQKMMGDSDSAEWPAMAKALGQAVQQRHALIYLNDSQAENILHELTWDGALRWSPGDYLMIVDSNVGFNKVGPNVEQTADYQVSIDASGTPLAQLTLTYRHRIQRPTPACVLEPRYGDSYADLMERCYWDYLRVYLPLGSNLVELSGGDSPAEVFEETGRTVVATSFLLETGQARQIRILYRLQIPPSQGRYTLLVQKQPGTQAMPIRVTVALPEGAHPGEAQPAPLGWIGNQVIWQVTSPQDLELTLDWD